MRRGRAMKLSRGEMGRVGARGAPCPDPAQGSPKTPVGRPGMETASEAAPPERDAGPGLASARDHRPDKSAGMQEKSRATRCSWAWDSFTGR